MTDIPLSDSPVRMGRPPLKKDIDTKVLMVRFPEDLLEKLKKLAGDKKLAEYIRELVEREAGRLK